MDLEIKSHFGFLGFCIKTEANKEFPASALAKLETSGLNN